MGDTPHRPETRRSSPTAESTHPSPDGAHDLAVELAGHSAEGLLFVSPAGIIVAVAGRRLLGRVFEPGEHVLDDVHPDDLPTAYELIERARRTTGFDERVRVRVRRADGAWRELEARVFDTDLEAAGETVRGAVVRLRDVTGEGPLTVPDRTVSLADLVPVGVLTADARGLVTFANPQAGSVFDAGPGELRGEGWIGRILSEDRPAVADLASRMASTNETHTATFRVLSGAAPRWILARFARTVAGGGAAGWVATVEDVTERLRAESELAHRATHDVLTGLPNRALLEDRLRQACGRLQRDASSVTVLFIDLDRFKEVNDRHGHQAGDRVLVEVARRLGGVVRQIDTVARLGGDEFAAVCESLPPGEAERVVARMAESLAEPIAVGDATTSLGASVGVVVTQDPMIEVADLLALADRAMYRVKGRRRRRIPRRPR